MIRGVTLDPRRLPHDPMKMPPRAIAAFGQKPIMPIERRHRCRCCRRMRRPYLRPILCAFSVVRLPGEHQAQAGHRRQLARYQAQETAIVPSNRFPNANSSISAPENASLAARTPGCRVSLHPAVAARTRVRQVTRQRPNRKRVAVWKAVGGGRSGVRKNSRSNSRSHSISDGTVRQHLRQQHRLHANPMVDRNAANRRPLRCFDHQKQTGALRRVDLDQVRDRAHPIPESFVSQSGQTSYRWAFATCMSSLEPTPIPTEDRQRARHSVDTMALIHRKCQCLTLALLLHHLAGINTHNRRRPLPLTTRWVDIRIPALAFLVSISH